MLKQDLKFDLDVASVLPTEFSLGVFFSSPISDSKAKVVYSSSEDVTCHWRNQEGDQITLAHGTSTILKCSRNNSAQKSYVKIINENTAQASMTIPWRAYNELGIAIDVLSELESKHSQLLEQNRSLLLSLKESVVPFELEKCQKVGRNIHHFTGDLYAGLINLERAIQMGNEIQERSRTTRCKAITIIWITAGLLEYGIVQRVTVATPELQVQVIEIDDNFELRVQ